LDNYNLCLDKQRTGHRIKGTHWLLMGQQTPVQSLDGNHGVRETAIT